MKPCNNKSACHTPETVAEDQNALRVLCTTCKMVKTLRKDPIKNVPEKRSYARFFKKDILQGGDNLFYKYYPQYLYI